MCHARSQPCVSILFLLFAALVSGCVYSDSPLSDPHKSAPDKSLAGVWTGKSADGSTAVLTIGQDSYADGEVFPKGFMVCSSIALQNGNTKIKAGFFESGLPKNFGFFVTRIGDNSYINAFPYGEHCFRAVLKTAAEKTFNWQAPDGQKWTFWKYQVKGATLTVWQMDSGAAATAVENGQIKGKAVRAKDGKTFDDNVTFSDSGTNMVKYLISGGDKALFPDGSRRIYKRLVGPSD